MSLAAVVGMKGGWVRKRMGAVLGLCVVIAIGACGAKIETRDAEPQGSGGSAAGSRTKPSPPKTSVGGTSMAGSHMDPPQGIAGEGPVPCGGCAQTEYSVRCAHRIVTAKPSDGEPYFWDPDEACVAAQAEASGTAGAPNESQAGAPNATTGGRPGAPEGSDGVGGDAPDACESYVDPPATYWDEGCIGMEDEDRAGTCTIDGECCVIISFVSCGV
jgi:hypothetical protein